jgi:hypothetical protein
VLTGGTLARYAIVSQVMAASFYNVIGVLSGSW